jgi:hypothetical protein
MKELEYSDLVSINGGAEGDFAEFHGIVTGLTLRILEASFTPLVLLRMYRK